MALSLDPEALAFVQSVLSEWVPGVPVYAFGSRANGTARKWSDLDLMLMTESPLSLAQMGDLREAFMESDLPIRVDLVDGARSDDEFRSAALKESVRII